MNVIAIDQSTDVTGIALVHVPEVGRPVVIASAALDGTAYLRAACKDRPQIRKEKADKQRQRRIAWMRHEFAVWIGRQVIDREICLDLVAFEIGGGPGSTSSQAGDQALGAFLSLSTLIEIPLAGVMRGSACTSVGAHGVYREKAGSTPKEKAEKRSRLKVAVIAGVNRKCCLELTDSDDGRADAIAVGIAAGEAAWREQKVQEAKAAQGTLKMRRSSVKKETVTS